MRSKKAIFQAKRFLESFLQFIKSCMILLHGFIKKDQKLPEKEKNTAIERRKKIDTGDCNEK